MEQSCCYDVEFEFLSILCQYKETLGLVIDRLKPEYFNDTNRIIFFAIAELNSLGLSIDVITLQHALKNIKNGEIIPVSVLSSLYKPVDEIKFESYLSILIERYKTSRQRLMANEIQKALQAGKNSIAIQEIISKFSTDIDMGVHRPRVISAVSKKVEKDIEEQIIEGMDEGSNFVKFGIDVLDLRDRMRRGNVYVFAGKPASGKTSMAIQCLYYNTFIEKKRCIFFSLEMTEEEVLESFYCFHHKIDNETYMKMAKEKRLKEIRLFTAYLESNNIQLIIDDSAINIKDIVSRAKLISQQKPVDLIVIDYIQMAKAFKSFQKMSDEITHIVDEVKVSLSKKLNTPVIMLSQMNRNSDNNDMRIPIMADLKESSSIEQYASAIYFAHRVDPMIRKYFDDDGQLKNEGQTLFVCVKSRFNQTGIYQSWFTGKIKRFVKTKEEMVSLISESEEKCKLYLSK